MENHSHAAHEVGAAPDDHGHAVHEVTSAATEDDLHWVKRELESLRGSIRSLHERTAELEAQAQAEREIVAAIQAGAVTIPGLVRVLRERASYLLQGGQLPDGAAALAHLPDFDRNLWLGQELHVIASQIEAGR